MIQNEISQISRILFLKKCYLCAVKRYYRYFLVLFFLPLTSCFEIVEEMKVNRDGSGTFALSVDLSQSKARLDNFRKQDSVMGARVPKAPEITRELEKVKQTLAGVSGISNVQYTEDFITYKFSFSFSFSRISALDQGIKVLTNKNPHLKEVISYRFEDNNLIRSFDEAKFQEGKKKIGPFIWTGIGAGKLISLHQFEQEIQKSSSEKTKILSSKKSSVTTYSLSGFLANQNNSTLTITLK